MIAIAILKQMVADQVAGLIINKDFFYEELPLYHDGKPAEGVWIVTRGGSAQNTPKGHNLKTTLDFYIAKKNKAQSDEILAQIAAWIRSNRCICELSGSVDGNLYAFYNVRITPATTPMNNGATTNGNIVKLASANIVYDINH